MIESGALLPRRLGGRFGRGASSAGRAFLAVLWLAAAVVGQEAAAQEDPSTLSGQVLIAEGEEPLAGIVVHLVHPDGEGEIQMTDARGRFVFRDLEPGTYEVRWEHLDRELLTETIEIDRADHTYDLDVRLEPEIVLLDPLEVVGRRELDPFDPIRERQAHMQDLGLGHFIGPEELEQRSASRVQRLLSTVPGARMRSVGGASLLEIARVPEVAMVLNQERVCAPAYYVDGRRLRLETDDGDVRSGRPETIDDYVHPDEIAFVEVYRSPAQIPAEFTGSEAQCGVVAIWTRRGRDLSDLTGDGRRTSSRLVVIPLGALTAGYFLFRFLMFP